MKNLKWTLFFAVILILVLPFQSQAQEVVDQVATGGLFSKIGTFLNTKIAAFIAGSVISLMGIKPTKLLWVKVFAKKAQSVTKELGEAFLETSDAFGHLEQSIKEDSTIDQNSFAELIAARKPLIAQWKDVVISIKPK